MESFKSFLKLPAIQEKFDQRSHKVRVRKQWCSSTGNREIAVTLISYINYNRYIILIILIESYNLYNPSDYNQIILTILIELY